jgi:hypothetical protein
MREFTPAAATCLLLSACAHAIPLPMTSGQLEAQPGTSQLVVYLGQPDADAQVCDGPGAPPHDAALGAEIVAALREGKVAPPTWGSCVQLLLHRLDASRAADLADRMVRAAAALLADPSVEKDAAVQARLEALAQTYLERDDGAVASDSAASALDGARREPLGPAARRAAEMLQSGLEMERGRWRGRPVDTAALEAMASQVGVGLLLRAARRLPSPALRNEAAMRCRTRRRAGGVALEEAVLQRGANPVPVGEHPPAAASLRISALPARTVILRQRPLEGAATLLGRAAERPTPSVLPAIQLRGPLQIELAGLSRPITLCPVGRALDPTPCLAPGDVASGSPLARVRAGGDLRVEERMSQEAVVALARQGGPVRIPVAVGGAPAGVLVWPVTFERPPDVVLAGPHAGDAGPDLAVTVERLDQGHLAYRIEGAGSPLAAVVELADASSFRVVSQGAPGADGSDGMDGSDGSSGLDGSSASCPSFGGGDGSPGGDGGRGTDGGDGSPGGRGGDVQVTVAAPPPLRDATLKLARASVASKGGRGGAGGRGGRGGQGGVGGAGGSGATCTDGSGHTTSLSGGSPGRSGTNGTSGSSGRNGPPGQPGVVRFGLAP